MNDNHASLHKALYLLIGLAVLVNFSGIFVPLMDPDAGVYAAIAKRMALSNDWGNLVFEGKDWLDKPHMPFWLTAVFFKVFGFRAFAYKLPGLLCALMGVAYIYLFAKKFYSQTTALLAAFMLLTSFHFVVSNNDVRAEPFLVGFIMAAIYHFSQSLNKALSWQLVAACFFTACAVMTKGIYTLIAIGAAVGVHLLVTRQWREILNVRWLVALLLVALFITPELYSLYAQFDAHPEKVVFGQTGVSGIRFFLWDSQFGRFFGTGPIVQSGKSAGDKFFFLHTLIWAFLPWCVLMYAALIKALKALFIAKERSEQKEWFTFGTIVVMLFVFSFSGFQLPFYTNILFPMMAVMSAAFVEEKMLKGGKAWPVTQNAIAVLLVAGCAFIYVVYRPSLGAASNMPGEVSAGELVAALVLALLVWVWRTQEKSAPAAFAPYLRSGMAIMGLLLFLNLAFYPDLLKYQAGNQAAAYLNQKYPGKTVMQVSDTYIPAGRFYLQGEMQYVELDDVPQLSRPCLVYASAADAKKLTEKGVAYRVEKEFDRFHITLLKWKFFNHATRDKALDQTYLLWLD
jgi:4-amino-4-deoxy-L-arabinose transferase-like glycosyltransferase